MKRKVLIFARSFLLNYAAKIKSDFFDTILVVLTREEKEYLVTQNITVYGCFEEDYAKLEVAFFPGNYLKTSYYSDRFLNRFDIDKRHEILGKEITFWRNILTNFEPDFIVNETVSIEASEVMAIEAEKKKIPFFSDLQGFFPYSFYFKPNPFHGRLDDISHIVPKAENLIKAKEYFRDVKEKNYKPFYVLDSLEPKKFSLRNLLGAFYRDTLLFVRKQKIKKMNTFKYEDYYSYKTYKSTKRIINRIFFKYDSILELKNKRIVFFPLHFEPEAILSYFAEEYQNQVSTIESIARTLKLNQYLVIKEHPQQKGALLDKRYRELKKTMPNLIYISAEVNSFDIIKRAEAVITLTSTAAWEGVIFGKPVFVLGKIFYDQCPGVKKIENFTHLKEEIRKDEYIYPNEPDVIMFIARMISILNKGSATVYAKEDFMQNVQDYTKAIERMILGYA